MKILFTSVGRRVELMQAFRNAANKTNTDLKIYGADMSLSAPALAYCDKKIEICPIRSDKYIPALVDICRREKIDALIPTIDTDLLVLAENKDQFEQIGTRVLISAPDRIAICRDKRYTSEFFVECGLKAPMPVDDYTMYDGGYPAFIKPKDGSSSIDAYRVENESDLASKSQMVDDYIIQPFIQGREYTVDIFCDFEHKPLLITPRERLAVRSGEVLKTQIVLDERIIEECKSIVERFQPVGQITVQLIRQETTGDDYYIEINPRFGGGAPLSIMAGADSAEAVIKMLNGELGTELGQAADGAIYSRFDQSICVDHGVTPEIEAVIFDLDDTIFNEVEYIRSGYKAIEVETGVSADELWQAYQDGKPAIDYVLDKSGQSHLKDKCLNIYRNHIPDIEANDGIIELISRLRQSGIFVGIITDGRPEGQRAKLQSLGITVPEVVDKIIITDELGGAAYRKPCDIAFRMMQVAANVDYGRMVYIGDNPKKDFVAPTQLGMQSIWFNNPVGIYRGDTYDGVTATSIEEIGRILEGSVNEP